MRPTDRKSEFNILSVLDTLNSKEKHSLNCVVCFSIFRIAGDLLVVVLFMRWLIFNKNTN
jgi:hypothetical protein